MSDLVDIFGPSASDSAQLAGIFGTGTPDFSDVIGGATSTADDARRRKHAELAAALAAQQGAPNAGLGGAPREDGIVFNNMAADLGRNVLSGAKQGADFVAHLPTMALNSMGSLEESAAGLGAPGNRSPLREAVRNPDLDAAVVPTVPREPVAPLTLTDLGLPPVIEDTFQSARDERSRLADAAAARGAANGLPPALSALTFAVPQTVGNVLDPVMLLGAGEAGRASKALEDAPLLTKIFGPPAADASKVLLDEAPGDAAFLANRAKVMRTLPGGEEPFVGPGAVSDAVAPRGGILQVGRQADSRAQDLALGLRAPDAADQALLELQRASLPIGETPPPTGYRFQRDPGAPAGHPDRGGVWFSADPDPATYRRTGGNSMYEGGRNLVSAPMDFENPALIEEPHPGPRNGPSHWVVEQHDPEFLKMVASAPPEGQQAILEQMGVPTFEAQNIVQRNAAYKFASDRRAADILRGQGHDGAILSREGKPTEFIDLRPPAAPPSLAEIFGERPANPIQNIPESFNPPAASPFSPPIEAPPDPLRLTPEPAQAGLLDPLSSSSKPPDAAPTLRNLLTREEVPLDTPTTGTMHAITRAEQDAAGLPRTTPAPSSDPWEQARQVFEQDPQAPRQLAQEVAAKPRPLSDFENHLLAHDRAQLKPAYEGALSAEEQALATGDPEQIAAAKLHRLSVERDFQTNADAADLGGTESGKGLQARQKQITEDYQPLNLIRRYKVANMGEEAPDAVRAKLVDISQQLEAAQTRLAAAEDRAQTLEAQRMIHSENLDTARVVRSKGRATVTAGLDQEYSDLSAQWRKATGLAQSGVNPDQAAILAKMARNRVRAGVTNLHDLVDGIFQDARPHLDTLEPQDVRDAIAGASPKGQAAAKKQAVSDFAALRREARVLNALDASQGKLAAAGDSRAAGALRKEVARWQAEADKISAGTGPRQAGGPLSDPERLRAALQRNTARQAELRDQIASGTFVSKTRAPLADSSLVAARADTQRLQRAADAIIGRRELQNRSFLQKALDLTAATARFTPLTSVTGTLPKLGAAAGMRSLIFRPAEQLLSVADPYLPLLKHFANEAPVEGGGVGLSALKKSYQGFFSKEAAAEAAAHLRGEEGPLALAMGKAHPPSGAPAFMDYPAHLHAAVKSPTVVAGFNWAMETQARALRAAGKGDLLLDASTRAEMESRAWEVAMRDIMLNDNSAVNRFNRALDKLPQDSAATRMGIATVRSQMPIVKVPANYVTQITDYFNGLPKAAGAMTATVYRGMKALPAAEGRTIAEIVHAGLQASPPGYADYIMRNMKRGRLGAALAALVTTGAVEVGGYYRKGEHRSEDDLQPGEIRIGGKDVGLQLPHNLLHSPAIEFMQAVGTIKRSKTLAQGLGTSALGIAGQVPFFEEAQRVGRDLPDNPAKFAGMAARQITEPPDMQKLARILDQSKERTTAQKVEQGLGLAGLQVGDWKVPEIAARKRVPHGSFWHQLLGQEELGIPGLREKVR